MTPKFEKLRKKLRKYKSPMTPPAGKATAEADASRNPMKYLKNKSYLDFGKNIKGVAF